MKNKILTILIIFSSLGAQASPEDEILDGHYKMQLKIGNTLFKDEMELRGDEGPIRLFIYGGKIQGSITVPGIFSSPLEGNASCSLWASRCNLEFTILANEQGQTYKVHYKASLTYENYLNVINHGQQPLLTGSAYHENGDLLGTFEATRQ